MSQTLQSLGIDKMSLDDRLRLVEEIWDSIASEESELPVPELQLEDLQRRVADYEANPGKVSTWEDVKARLR